MEELFLPLLVALTSVGAYAVGRVALGLSPRELGPAVRHALEVTGLAVVFLLANLGIGLAAVLGARALSTRFISVYILNDASLIALSALQAIVADWWWRSGTRVEGARQRST